MRAFASPLKTPMLVPKACGYKMDFKTCTQEKPTSLTSLGGLLCLHRALGIFVLLNSPFSISAAQPRFLKLSTDWPEVMLKVTLSNSGAPTSCKH